MSQMSNDCGMRWPRRCVQLGTDEGARSLGEVSLVDRDLRIAKAGILFHTMLFDENAGCHVAWGSQ